MALAEEVYRATNAFPRSEEFGLKSQLRRAAISVPSNIAEGGGRTGPRAFAAHVDIALGSLREVETLTELSLRLGFGEVGSLRACQATASRVAGQLVTLLRGLRRTPR